MLYLKKTAYGETGLATVNAYGQPGWSPSAYFSSGWALDKAFTPPGWDSYADLLPYGRWPTDSGYEVFDWMPWAIRGSTPIAGGSLSGPLGQGTDFITQASAAAGGIAQLAPQISDLVPKLAQASDDVDSLMPYAKVFFGVGIVALGLVGFKAIRDIRRG